VICDVYTLINYPDTWKKVHTDPHVLGVSKSNDIIRRLRGGELEVTDDYILSMANKEPAVRHATE